MEHGSTTVSVQIKNEPSLTSSTLADVGNTIPVVGTVVPGSTPKKQPAKRKRASGAQSKRTSSKKSKCTSNDNEGMSILFE